MNFKQMANVTADMIGENMFDRRNGVFVVSTTRCYLFNNNPMKGDPDDSLRDKQFEAMRNWGEETGTFRRWPKAAPNTTPWVAAISLASLTPA